MVVLLIAESNLLSSNKPFQQINIINIAKAWMLAWLMIGWKLAGIVIAVS